MSTKTERLFNLLQLLRAYRYPVSAQILAEKLKVSKRALYRDIEVLKSQGADIEGEPGLDYQLQPGFMLPPLMFELQEIEALVLGMRWVAKKTDSTLQQAGQQVLDKIRAVLPISLQRELDLSSLMIGPNPVSCLDDKAMVQLRKAIQLQVKIEITYLDIKGQQTQRTLWPLGIAFFDGIRILIAWCEKRQAFRHFRTDRIKHLAVSSEKYMKSKSMLLRQWRLENNIPEQ
jgi:predicted DNA-binding transcriptional regulator YafY